MHSKRRYSLRLNVNFSSKKQNPRHRQAFQMATHLRRKILDMLGIFSSRVSGIQFLAFAKAADGFDENL